MSAEAPAPDGIFDLVQPFSYGRAQLVPLAIARPAVTLGFSIPVTGAYRLRLVALTASLVTDSNAANRIVNLDVQDADGNVVLRIPPAGVQAASLTWQYSWAVGVQPSTPANTLSAIQALPPIILPVGWSWVVSYANAQAGDRFATPAGLVERFPTGPTGYPTRYVAGADQLST